MYKSIIISKFYSLHIFANNFCMLRKKESGQIEDVDGEKINQVASEKS